MRLSMRLNYLMFKLVHTIFARCIDYEKLMKFNFMGSFSPGGSYLVSKWTIEKAEFYGIMLEDGKLIEVIRKEVKDIVFTEI
jgi:hypothetical protein